MQNSDKKEQKKCYRGRYALKYFNNLLANKDNDTKSTFSNQKEPNPLN